jgi:tellurite resistance protein
MVAFRKRHGAYARRGGPREAPTREQAGALVEVMVMAACVDGILAPGEADALATQILATPGFEGMDNKGLIDTVEQVIARVSRDGIGQRLHAAAEALGSGEQLREEAFMLATLFVLYDGEVAEEEQSFLDLLQRELAITDERASHISAVLSEDQERASQGA